MTTDIGCRTCGSTFTDQEQHDCPGYDLWAQRDATAVGIGSEQFLGRIDRSGRFLAHSLELEVRKVPKYERPPELMGVEIGGWREVGEICAGVIVIGALWIGFSLLLYAWAA